MTSAARDDGRVPGASVLVGLLGGALLGLGGGRRLPPDRSGAHRPRGRDGSEGLGAGLFLYVTGFVAGGAIAGACRSGRTGV